MKIATIVGARPQFIKAAMLSKAIHLHNQNNQDCPIDETVIHTGQHYDPNMSTLFFEEMNVPQPKYNLNISNLPHAAMTGRMMEKLEAIWQKDRPDWTVVYGDTNSTLAGALAAVKMHIPVMHIEAGLRSFNLKMPEEINRRVTDCCSTLLLTPTEKAALQLKKEGIEDKKIKFIGDVMYDASLHYRELIKNPKAILEKYSLHADNYLLATVHRAENTNNRDALKGIFDALKEIAKELPVILPLHPRTKQILETCNDFESFTDGLIITEPLSYFDILALQSQAKIIATDSGGMQKEAYFFKKPCLIMRTETEWTELIENGFSYLVGHSKEQILQNYQKSLRDNFQWDKTLYGDGQASSAIVKLLINTPINK